MDTLDYTGPDVNKGSKAVLLGVGAPHRKLPQNINDTQKNLPDWVGTAAVFTAGCLVIDTGKAFDQEGLSPQEMVRDKQLADWPLVVLVDDAEKAARTTARFLWTTFTRFEPAADIYTAEIHQRRNTVSYGGPMLWDCRLKPRYPQELFCDEKTRTTVDERWSEYFPQGMDMGDGDNGHLDTTL
jgi:3-polyprenyl-4-hydroxybenzoate decarboxylase